MNKTCVVVCAGLCAIGSLSRGAVIGATSGSRSAQAEFTVAGDVLTVRLSNVSTADTLAPIDVLTGIFFNATGGVPALTPVSAVVPGGHVVLFGGTDAGGVVSGEWAYRAGLAGAPFSLTNGISSSGLGLFGPGDVFPGGSNLQGPAEPDGVQYGITAAGDNPSTGNTPVTGPNALIKSEVAFTFTGATGFDPNTINEAVFQYGTALDEPSLHVPTPGSAALLGLAGLIVARRRR